MNDVNFLKSNHVKKKETFLEPFSLSALDQENKSSVLFRCASTGIQSNANSLQNKDAGKNCSTGNKNTFVKKTFKGLRFLKKADIRVSRCVPAGVHFSEDMIDTFQNVEEHGLTNAPKTEKVCNQTGLFSLSENIDNVGNDCTETNVAKVQNKSQGSVFNLIKNFQHGIERLSNSTSKSDPPQLFIKTVEIVRDPNEILGIFIKQKKVIIKHDNTVQLQLPQQNSRNSNARKGIFISKLIAHCKAAKLLQVGDEIIAVNTKEINSYDIKSVAAMMCVLKRLILTVKTVQSKFVDPFGNEQFLPPAKKVLSENKDLSSFFVFSPEKNVSKPFTNSNCNNSNDSVSSLFSSLNIKNSVYDNNLDFVPLNEDNLGSSKNSIQLKFDESVQILYDAIACCDKSTSAKVKDSKSFLSAEDGEDSGWLFSNSEQKDIKNSFSSEMRERHPYVSIEACEDINDSVKSNDCFTVPTHESEFLTDCNFNSDIQSDHSSCCEINLDDVDFHHYDSSIHQNLQNSSNLQQSISLCSTSKSFESVASSEFDSCQATSKNILLSKNCHSANKDATNFSSVNLNKSFVSHDNRSHKYENKSIDRPPNSKVPKFPVALINPLPAAQTLFQPLGDITSNHGNITVDKKKEWLSSGSAVSEELKKRLDGEINEKVFEERCVENETNLQELQPANIACTTDTEKSSSIVEETKSTNYSVSHSFLQNNSPAVLDTSKLASPGRLRKKNRSKKWAKKFRIVGNSDSGMSTCWNTENESQSGYLQEGFHTELAVSQNEMRQHRLSRQLCFDNKSKDLYRNYLSVSQFEKYKPLPVIGEHNSAAVDGCLVITLYGVRELKKTFCDACCFVQVDDASTKRIGTTMQACRGATTWNQCFEMIVSGARNLVFTVHTWNSQGEKHVTSPHAVINLPLLLQGHKTLHSHRLAVVLQPRGTLYVKLALESDPSSFGPRLFGADLQNIADQEESDIPALVRFCISEVEERGLNVVGVYRLCGSAIVKKELRKKLEENKGAVDLSAPHYPDINVITGILKDFIRELPQPIFPPELLEVVANTMEKNPGPAPSIIKEPFAPNPNVSDPKQQLYDDGQKKRTCALLRQIESLPSSPAERSTLYALMGHLKKVALHSDKNKMTHQNLAVCFGPVLLGPLPNDRMDINAAVGFKRHIQVLHYMISNWPSEPLRPPTCVRRRAGKGQQKDANRVSLTRRLSRVNDADVEPPLNDVIAMQAELEGIPEHLSAFRDPDLSRDA